MIFQYYYFLLAGFGLSQMEYIVAIMLLCLKQFDIQMYKFKYDQECYGDVLSVINKECITTGVMLHKMKHIPSGLFLNRHAIGYINADGCYSLNETRITIITRPEYFKKITLVKEVVFNETEFKELATVPQNTINIYTRHGSYDDFYYNRMTLNIKNLKPLPTQEPIIKSILDVYNAKRQVTVFIDGVPGSGKSSIGYLVAKELNGSFCHSFNPTDPGDIFARMVTMIKDREENDNPIVVVLEEIDIILSKVHNLEIKENQTIPTSVKDKSSWVAFLDDMFFFTNVIVILTSNKSKHEIDLLDQSYLRKGRVNGYYTLDVPIVD